MEIVEENNLSDQISHSFWRRLDQLPKKRALEVGLPIHVDTKGLHRKGHGSSYYRLSRIKSLDKQEDLLL